MTQAFGIDFGTTNSAVVEYRYGRSTNIGDDDGSPFPSVVVIDTFQDQITCGRKIKNRLIELREQDTLLVIESVKSALATDAVWQVSPAKIATAEDVACELFKALSRKAKEFV